MKQVLLLLLAGLFALSYGCHSPKIKTDTAIPADLLYDAAAIKRLRYCADSAQAIFDPGKLPAYYSMEQCKADYITVTTNVREFEKAIAAGISFEEFTRKYPKATMRKDLLVVRQRNETDSVIYFQTNSLGVGGESYITIDKNVEQYTGPMKDKWVYDYYLPENEIAEIKAFYFPEEFRQQPIPAKWAKMIAYADHMIDTNTVIFTDEPHYSHVGMEEVLMGFKDSCKVLQFIDYVKAATGYPESSENEKDWDRDYKLWQQWESVKIYKAQVLSLFNSQFWNLYNTALEEAATKKTSLGMFEEYVAFFTSKEKALELKRNRIVYASCGMDWSPRYHLWNIARLAGATAQWDIFLRAHLEVLNLPYRENQWDSASTKRNTYVAELEAIDINVQELVLGATITLDNPAKNRFELSEWDAGRGLSESRSVKNVEQILLQMITDPALDDYNRVVAYRTFENVQRSRKLDEQKRTEINEQLKKAITSLPPYLQL